jgi:transposase
MSDLFGVGGVKMLDQLQLDPPYQARVLSLRRLVEAFDFEIDVIAKRITGQLRRQPGYRAIQAINGVGPVLAMVFVAEIGDITSVAWPRRREPQIRCARFATGACRCAIGQRWQAWV